MLLLSLETRYRAEVMLSAKEQRATEIIIYELRKWDDESHRRLSVTGINIIAATYEERRPRA